MNKKPKFDLSEKEWREKLSPPAFQVLRKKGTEPAFTGEYWNHKGEGEYLCAGCEAKLFDSETKFDSGCGWPSFYQASDEEAILEEADHSHGMVRTEVMCSHCGGHLGHVFPDGFGTPTGNRYCINSLSIKFKEKP